MNKIIKTISACACLLAMESAAFAEINVSFEDTYYLTAEYTGSESFKRATIQIDCEASKIPIYVGQSANVVKEDEVYKAIFPRIKLSNRLLDNTYTIKVGVNGTIESTDFSFENTPEKKAATERLLNVTSAVEMGKCIESDSVFLGIDADKFMTLEQEQREKLCTSIFNLMPFEGENNEEKKNSFLSVYEKQYELAMIMYAQDKIENVTDGLNIVTVDRKYYDLLKDKTEFVRAYTASDVKKITELDEEKIMKCFDGAVLCAVVSTCDYKSAAGAIDYYAKKGVITEPDKTYFNKLTDLQKSEVLQLLQKEKIDDCGLIAKRFESSSYDVYIQNKDKGSASSGSNGGGSSSKGMIIAAPIYPEPSVANTTKDEQNNPAVEFSDMENAEWAMTAVAELSKKGYISGDGNGLFRPNDNVLREEFLKMAVLSFDKMNNEAEADFIDVSKDKWYYGYIASGIKAGIIKGISDLEFGIERNITRQDAATILYRIYNGNSQNNRINFADSDEISDYASEAVNKLATAGIINGMNDGKFYPEKNLTRAEAAVLIYRLMNKMGVYQY